MRCLLFERCAYHLAREPVRLNLLPIPRATRTRSQLQLEVPSVAAIARLLVVAAKSLVEVEVDRVARRRRAWRNTECRVIVGRVQRRRRHTLQRDGKVA